MKRQGFWICFICKRAYKEEDKKKHKNMGDYFVCKECFSALDGHGLIRDINLDGDVQVHENVEVRPVYKHGHKQYSVNLKKTKPAKRVVVIKLD